MVLESLQMELTVVLGQTKLPLHKLLRMGRGALLALDAGEPDMVDILANGLPIARGRVGVENGVISVEVTELCRKPEITRTPGATIGGGMKLPMEPTHQLEPA